MDRDGRRCTVCGTPYSLEVHHRDGNSDNDHEDNLVTMCEECHDDVTVAAA